MKTVVDKRIPLVYELQRILNLHDSTELGKRLTLKMGDGKTYCWFFVNADGLHPTPQEKTIEQPTEIIDNIVFMPFPHYVAEFAGRAQTQFCEQMDRESLAAVLAYVANEWGENIVILSKDEEVDNRLPILMDILKYAGAGIEPGMIGDIEINGRDVQQVKLGDTILVILSDGTLEYDWPRADQFDGWATELTPEFLMAVLKSLYKEWNDLMIRLNAQRDEKPD